MNGLLKAGLALVAGGSLALAPLAAQADPYTPGAPGAGDSYFPQDGNGGYDVRHYDLAVEYRPATDRVIGTTTIVARATQNLSRFDLDLTGLTVRSITVDGDAATWKRNGQELVVTPPSGLAAGSRFSTVVTYDGSPATIEDELGDNGFFHTTDGAFVAGEPHGAAAWYPVSDHPSDKATYTFHITTPKGLQTIANGVLKRRQTSGAKTTWTWVENQPMASYLATFATGHYTTKAYTSHGLKVVDAVDSDLFTPFATPRTGSRYAVSGAANNSYKRLARTFSVPAGGASLSFDIARDTELTYDYVFVEAHTVGADDWTTLPDENGHTSQSTGNACTYGWAGIHPFLEHYQTRVDDDTCTPSGTTGDWWGATGASDGYENWKVDLSPYAGKDVEVSITYVSDDVNQGAGVFVDDVVSSTGDGSTSFEADADPLDGWHVPGPPEGSPGNDNDWQAGTADLVVTPGDIARGSLSREGEIVGFLSSKFGHYPFDALGGIVPDEDRLGFALETQTRPVYGKSFFSDPVSGDSVVVHELTHQWFGDSLALERWKYIWLNEGFATYAEWLWSEHEGLGTAQENFDAFAAIPADDAFWNVTIGDPGPDLLFDGSVYYRGAMTLHALRVKIGDRAFFSLLKQWTRAHAQGNVTIPQFIRLAEKVSGKDLGGFFTTWLYTPEKPAGIDPVTAAAKSAATGAAGKPTGPARLKDLSRRYGDIRN